MLRVSHIPSTKAFTLVELLVVISIVGILSTVLLTSFLSMDSEVLLRNRAYELALELRQAQVLGISVRSEGTGVFQPAYGVHITLTDDTDGDTVNDSTREYILFRDTFPSSPNGVYDGGAGEDVVVFRTTFEARHEIFEFCEKFPSVAEDCDIATLDVTFKRPDPDAHINKPSASESGATEGKIKIQSTRNPGSVRTVKITSTGQISVE